MASKKLIFLPLFIILALPLINGAEDTYGWGNQTLVKNSELICLRFSDCVNQKCSDEIGEGASYPSYVIKDFGRMDYYAECKVTQESWCHLKDNSCQDCTAGQITNNLPVDSMFFYLNSAKGASGCEKYREVGKAFNYFLQTKNYWHQVKGEEASCASEFEAGVENHFFANQFNDWNIESCKKVVLDQDFKEWNAEFVKIVESELGLTSEKQSSIPPSQQSTSTQNAGTNSTKGTGTCLFENTKYGSKYCSGSRKIEGGVSKYTDPFSALLLLFVGYFIYAQFFKK
ncbi:hypothetical protein HY448_01015 [Candidatus Pacearchaeota archaeon]|nr:hypothetical protein [Candidatus Pacearchaeota archaeon]